MRRHHIILAPHVDDEVIGCSRLLLSRQSFEVLYVGEPTDARWVEARNLQARLGHQIFRCRLAKAESHINARRVVLTSPKQFVLVAPDPHWELHPFHKEVGSVARSLARAYGWGFMTYSTNMNVPYLEELDVNGHLAKQILLDETFPSQKELWQHDHRYFLFEGLCEWNPIV